MVVKKVSTMLTDSYLTNCCISCVYRKNVIHVYMFCNMCNVFYTTQTVVWAAFEKKDYYVHYFITH